MDNTRSQLDCQNKAFRYEEGQYVCHIRADIQPDERDVLDETIRIILDHRDSSKQGWKSLCSDQQAERSLLHLTLLRGHRAIYYHHIKPLVNEAREICSSFSPVKIFLGDLKLFHNHEKTREFLCLATYPFSEANLKNLKERLKEKIDQYAIKLSVEDETPETLTHCSLLSRDISTEQNCTAHGLEVDKLSNICISHLGDIPEVAITISSIKLAVGCVTYDLKLAQ